MATSTFIEISSDDVGILLGYVKDLISDLTPLLLPIIAVALGLIIFYAIVHAIRG